MRVELTLSQRHKGVHTRSEHAIADEERPLFSRENHYLPANLDILDAPYLATDFRSRNSKSIPMWLGGLCLVMKRVVETRLADF